MWSHVRDKVSNDSSGTLEPLIAGKCWLIRNLLSEKECTALIEASEKNLDYELVSGFSQYRCCYRVKFEDPPLLHWLFGKLKPFIPEYQNYWFSKYDEDSSDEEYFEEGNWIVDSLNRYPRMCKYTTSKHHFAKHFDYSVAEGKNRRSFLTFMLYLNSQGKDFTGGNTNFLSKDEETIEYSVKPEQGLGILFLQDPEHQLLHEGEFLSKGCKYIFRTEVMFQIEPLSPRTIELKSL